MKPGTSERGLEIMVRQAHSAKTGADDTSPGDTIRVPLSFGFLLAGIVTGAAVALGSGAVNRWVWRRG
jgi:hypothetical protein